LKKWINFFIEGILNKKTTSLSNEKLMTIDVGILAVMVPPSKNTIVGGHVTNRNAGLLLYNLVLVGFKSEDVGILNYGCNTCSAFKGPQCIQG